RRLAVARVLGVLTPRFFDIESEHMLFLRSMQSCASGITTIVTPVRIGRDPVENFPIRKSGCVIIIAVSSSYKTKGSGTLGCIDGFFDVAENAGISQGVDHFIKHYAFFVSPLPGHYRSSSEFLHIITRFREDGLVLRSEYVVLVRGFAILFAIKLQTHLPIVFLPGAVPGDQTSQVVLLSEFIFYDDAAGGTDVDPRGERNLAEIIIDGIVIEFTAFQ